MGPGPMAVVDIDLKVKGMEGLRDGIGPVVGISLSLLSLLALTAGVRRFFAADHAWRWKYTALAVAVSCFVLVQLVVDVQALLD